MNIKKLTLSGLLIAVGTISGHLIYIPIGVSRIFPVQHTINVIAGVILGPLYAVGTVFGISLLRNILGTGSLLAFPGSLFGALLAALCFRYTGKYTIATLGEIIGTGFIGGLVAYPIAKFLLGSEVALFFFVPPFLLSTLFGGTIGYIILKLVAKHIDL
ncbi:thiW protein [Alkaliphilus metalliredigens QYMF]|uniref:ThiW protein n=1 Tax=Alkaliphilus metalliredigens (strain QYMF) TaxID=293826 RepID=A6TMN8_ALKMQ|nr:energy coupling factor transporter S component ThiW [Alkaliphilus metalliredigens]ABR47456.1 thiW protein [Alkaliphilus metalliredigens QYMF]